MHTQTPEDGAQKLRHESPHKAGLERIALLAILMGNLILIPMALWAMSEASGAMETLKLLVIGLAASAAAYTVSRFAIDRLAPLAALGFKSAFMVAVLSLVITGSGTFLGSYVGATSAMIEHQLLQAHGAALAIYTQQVNTAGLQAEQMIQPVTLVGEDLARTASCEYRNSCLSRVGSGGRGSMTIALEARAAQAQALLQTIAENRDARQARLEDLNALNARYQRVLNEGGHDLPELRTELKRIHADILQLAAELSESLPLPLIASFAQELDAQHTLPGNFAGSKALTAYLRGHGQSLLEALDGFEETKLIPPGFPDRPGMVDMLAYIGDYFAIAAIIFVAELLVPITLFYLTYLKLVWELEKRGAGPDAPPKHDLFDGLIDLSSDQGKPARKSEGQS